MPLLVLGMCTLYIPACIIYNYFLSFFWWQVCVSNLVNFCHFLQLFCFFSIYSVAGVAGDAAVGGLSSLVGLGVFKYFAGGMCRFLIYGFFSYHEAILRRFWTSHLVFFFFSSFFKIEGGVVAVISELLFAAFCVYVATTQGGKEKDVLDKIDDTNKSSLVEVEGNFQDQSSESILSESTTMNNNNNNNIDSEQGSIDG